MPAVQEMMAKAKDVLGFGVIKVHWRDRGRDRPDEGVPEYHVHRGARELGGAEGAEAGGGREAHGRCWPRSRGVHLHGHLAVLDAQRADRRPLRYFFLIPS